MPAGPPPPLHPGSGGAAGAELRRHPPVPPGVRGGVHGVPGHGRVRAAVVRRDSTGPDGVSHQEAARRRGHPLRKGPHLPAWEVRGQDPQEAVLGEWGSAVSVGLGTGNWYR